MPHCLRCMLPAQGFAKEIFTDAGKYVIHFGSTAAEQQQAHPQAPVQAQLQGEQAAAGSGAGQAAAPAPPVTAMAMARTDAALIPTSSGNQLVSHHAWQAAFVSGSMMHALCSMVVVLGVAFPHLHRCAASCALCFLPSSLAGG